MPDEVLRVSSVLLIVLTVLVGIFAVSRAARPRPVRVGRELLRVALGMAGAVIVGVVSSVGSSPAVLVAAAAVGVLVGSVRGRSLEVYVEGGRTLARGTPVTVGLFALGMVVVQAAALANRSGLLRLGQAGTVFTVGVGLGIIAGRHSGNRSGSRGLSYTAPKTTVAGAAVFGFATAVALALVSSPVGEALAQGSGGAWVREDPETRKINLNPGWQVGPTGGEYTFDRTFDNGVSRKVRRVVIGFSWNEPPVLMGPDETARIEVAINVVSVEINDETDEFFEQNFDFDMVALVDNDGDPEDPGSGAVWSDSTDFRGVTVRCVGNSCISSGPYLGSFSFDLGRFGGREQDVRIFPRPSTRSQATTDSPVSWEYRWDGSASRSDEASSDDVDARRDGAESGGSGSDASEPDQPLGGERENITPERALATVLAGLLAATGVGMLSGDRASQAVHVLLESDTSSNAGSGESLRSEEGHFEPLSPDGTGVFEAFQEEGADVSYHDVGGFTGWLVDSDGDGLADVALHDADGDGVPDTSTKIGEATDGVTAEPPPTGGSSPDGSFDEFTEGILDRLEDVPVGDRAPTHVETGKGPDGRGVGWAVDTDGDGQPDVAELDFDGDGRIDSQQPVSIRDDGRLVSDPHSVAGPGADPGRPLTEGTFEPLASEGTTDSGASANPGSDDGHGARGSPDVDSPVVELPPVTQNEIDDIYRRGLASGRSLDDLSEDVSALSRARGGSADFENPYGLEMRPSAVGQVPLTAEEFAVYNGLKAQARELDRERAALQNEWEVLIAERERLAYDEQNVVRTEARSAGAAVELWEIQSDFDARIATEQAWIQTFRRWAAGDTWLDAPDGSSFYDSSPSVQKLREAIHARDRRIVELTHERFSAINRAAEAAEQRFPGAGLDRLDSAQDELLGRRRALDQQRDSVQSGIDRFESFGAGRPLP